MVLAGSTAKIYDLNDKLVREISGRSGDAVHFANFLQGIREGKPLRAEIGEGQKSTQLCHLGNIAWRSGHTVNFDPEAQKVIGDKKATALCSRQYRKGWEPHV